MDKSNTKHTPGPLVFNQEEMKIKDTGDVEGRTVIANVSPKMDCSRGMKTQCANAERIVACWNACEGIEDPKEWIEEARKNRKAFWYEQTKSQRRELGAHIAKLTEERDQLLVALHKLVDLHLCEQEGLSSGMPTIEQWIEAVDEEEKAMQKAEGGGQ